MNKVWKRKGVKAWLEGCLVVTKRCQVIWYRKRTKEWRIALEKGGSSWLGNSEAQKLFQTRKLLMVQDEYFRRIYQLLGD